MSATNQDTAVKDQLITQLSATPLVFAAVVRVTKPRSGKGRPEDFQRGTQVRVASQDLLIKNVGKQGVIVARPTRSDLPNWVRVRFPDGERENYRIGIVDPNDVDSKKGECDLELVQTSRGGVIIACEGGLKEVERPVSFEVKAGDIVKVSQKTMQIVDLAPDSALGDICTVRRAIGEEVCEVDKAGIARIVFCTGLANKPQAGDRVVLDPTGSVVIANFGNNDDQFALKAPTNVSWDDVGGLENAKKRLKDAIERPYLRAALYAKYKKKPVKGILMYSAPGCGKTLLCKVLATAIAKAHKAESVATGYQYVKGPELLDPYVGGAEAKIRSIFDRTRKHFKKHGYPAIVVIDEADAILRERGTGVSSDIGNTIVPMFLAEMDGVEESGAIVILLTNIPDCLDSAVVRDMRIDVKIAIERPTQADAEKIFKIYFTGIPSSNEFKSVEEMSAFAAQELFSKALILYKVERRTGAPGAVVSMDFLLANLVSGAMVTGISAKSKEYALDRDDAADATEPSGITREDIRRAVAETFEGSRDTNHRDALKEFTKDFVDDVVNITKVLKQAASAS